MASIMADPSSSDRDTFVDVKDEAYPHPSDPHPSSIQSLLKHTPHEQFVSFLARLKSTDVIIAVMGMPGVGKTSFICDITGKNLPLNHGLTHGEEPCPKKIQIISTTINNRTVHLFDTPGLSGDHSPEEMDIVCNLLKYLCVAEIQHGVKLSAIFYIHRATDAQVSPQALRDFKVFARAGSDGLVPGVVLVATQWEPLDDEEQERRHGEIGRTLMEWEEEGVEVAGCVIWDRDEDGRRLVEGVVDVIKGIETAGETDVAKKIEAAKGWEEKWTDLIKGRRRGEEGRDTKGEEATVEDQVQYGKDRLAEAEERVAEKERILAHHKMKWADERWYYERELSRLRVQLDIFEVQERLGRPLTAEEEERVRNPIRRPLVPGGEMPGGKMPERNKERTMEYVQNIDKKGRALQKNIIDFEEAIGKCTTESEQAHERFQAMQKVTLKAKESEETIQAKDQVVAEAEEAKEANKSETDDLESALGQLEIPTERPRCILI